jgi:hypothetical protein
MKTALRINWMLTILLSISTGVFKLLQQEADIALFQVIGFNELMITALGFVQLVGGILLIPAKTRKWGAYVMIPTFIIASIAVFANSLMVFGMVSLLFIAMAYFVVLMETKFSTKAIENE